MKFKLGKVKERVGATVDFAGLLPGIINQFDIKKEFTIQAIESKWSDIAGDIMSTHTKPDRVFGGTLFIQADHPVFANELSLIQDTLLKKIEEELGTRIIKKIKVEIKNISWKR